MALVAAAFEEHQSGVEGFLGDEGGNGVEVLFGDLHGVTPLKGQHGCVGWSPWWRGTIKMLLRSFAIMSTTSANVAYRNVDILQLPLWQLDL